MTRTNFKLGAKKGPKFNFTLAEATIAGRMYSSTKYWNWFLAPSLDSS